MNQNYRSFKLKKKKIYSEFTDIKRVDGQILPIQFVWIRMAFRLLTQKEHRKLARNATN